MNPVFGRYKFYNEVQGTDTVENFLTRLKLSARECQFSDPDDMIRDRIVFATNSTKVRERLINEGADLTLDKAVQIAQSYQYSQEQLLSMNGPEVHAVRSKQQSHPREASRYQSNNPKPTRKPEGQRSRPTTSSSCGNCGYRHSKAEMCKAKGKQCDYCHKWNHFASMCRAKKHDKFRKSVNVVNCAPN